MQFRRQLPERQEKKETEKLNPVMSAMDAK